MSIKYFCDDCGKEMVLDQHPVEVDNGYDWTQYQHEQGIETAFYDKLTDERWSEHQCNACDEERYGER
jgi:hypothetical protein